jgi:vacuolar protein sorting-associated protein 13A/C
MKPLEGLQTNGLIGLGTGMMEGTGSLMKNTIAGACYSVNKFSGSLASCFTIISSDYEYI